MSFSGSPSFMFGAALIKDHRCWPRDVISDAIDQEFQDADIGSTNDL